jgi:MFS family permease
MSAAGTVAPDAGALRTVADYETGGYKWYVAAVLCLAHTVAMIDRFVMVLVSESVRANMHLTDTQLGLLQGMGFAILYCGLAIPLGCVADATNRRNLIIVGIALWSMATIAAAFTTSFETLFLTRILVGMGEACLIPAGMSLLSAYFAPANIARGTAIFGLGANFGYGLAFLGGGAVLAMLLAAGGLQLPGLGLMAPWQGIFVFAGLTAIPVLVLLLFVREPAQRHTIETGMRARFAGMLAGLLYLWRNLRFYAPFLAVASLISISGYAVTSWSVPLFVRLYDVGQADAGKLVGLIGLIAGPLGTLAGGIVLDRLRARGVPGAPLVIMACGALYTLVTVTAFVFSPNLGVAVVAFGFFMFGSTFGVAALYVGMQMLTPDGYRGVAASFNMMIYTLFGLGVGPTIVGRISDWLPRTPGALGTAVVIVEILVVLLIVPVALLSRRAFQARMRTAEAVR